MSSLLPPSFDIDKPRWRQDTFSGRFKHFLNVTDPRNCLASNAELDWARNVVDTFRQKNTVPNLTPQQIFRAQKLYMSAFHPDTGEKQNLIGRMSFQVPGGTILVACMLQFYKSTPAVFFWQWANQSFNCLVNYTNRNALTTISPKQLGVAYVSATASAMVAALGLKSYLLKRSSSSLLQRFVPFVAVAAANCVNIPLMRQSELLEGVAIFTKKDQQIGTSQHAARVGLVQVVTSRILIVAPPMLILPVIMDKAIQARWLRTRPRLHLPMPVGLTGLMLAIMVPIGCALFPQKCSLSAASLQRWEPAIYQNAIQAYPDLDTIHFNKGL